MSMNSLPDSIETPNSGIFEANPSRIAKVVYPDLNISSQVQVDEVQYAQMANEQLIQEVPLGVPSKKDFLTMIYRRLLIFSGSVWVFQILSLMRWFNAIMMVSYKQYWNSNYSFEQYKQWYGSSANDYDQNQLYNDYYQWKYSSYSEYYSLRWTFWVVVGLLLAQIIGTIILRNKPIMKRIQMGNYIAFTILVSFYIVGILGLSGRYLGCFFIGTNLSIIFFFVQLANIKHEFIKLTEQSLLRKTILISFILNIIFALTSSYISSITILLELLIPYPIYYFMQLNKSILEEYQVPQAPCNCLAKLKSVFTQQQVLPEQAIAIQTVRENHIVINKKHFKFGAIVVAIIGLMSLIGLHSEIFIILGIVALQMLARFVPTQIIPNDLNNKLTEQDYDLAIPLIFVDILFPIKNIRRSIKRYQ